MIRTNTVNLTVIPGIAYRQKFQSGGSGIVILRAESSQPGIASISKTSGQPIPSANTSAALYPLAAFEEAMELTTGMPYHKLGSVKLVLNQPADTLEENEEDKPAPEEEVIVDSSEYNAIVAAYTDKDGRLSYELLNRDLIRFAHQSSVVRNMIANKENIDDVRLYITRTKYRNITGNKDLTDAQVLKISELLDEVYPKGVFRDLNNELRAMAAKIK